MASHARRFEDDGLYQPPASRTRQYVKDQAEKQVKSREVSDLENRLDQEERRNLRLSSQLLDETRRSAAAERTRDELREEVLNLTTKLTEMEGPAKAKAKQPAKTPSEPEPTETETPAPKPKAKPKPVAGSSRVRGQVK